MLALALALALAPAHDDRTLVFVDDVKPLDASLAPDASALTTALCAALGKDKRVDVLCSPDVRQILSFAATAAMIGTGGGPSGALQERLERTKHVVSATFKKDKGKFVLVIKAGPKAADAQASALYSDKPIIALEERGDQERQLLDKIPSLASRVDAALMNATAAAATTAPPAPLTPEKPRKKAAPAGHGW